MSRAPFASLRPPRPPAELRRRVLVACAEASARGETDLFLDLLWRSRRARWAWLAVVAALALGNLALQPATTAAARPAGQRAISPVSPRPLLGLTGGWGSRPRVATWADLGPAAGGPGWPSEAGDG